MNTKGVNFQPSKRGQFSAAVDKWNTFWMEASRTGIPANHCPSQKQSASRRTHVAALRILFAGFFTAT